VRAGPGEREASMSMGAGPSSAVEEALAPIKRLGPKLGRNDACPLDPKKKFKNCCGATGSKVCFKVSA